MSLIITCASRFLNSRVLLSCSVMAARSCFSSFSIFRSWSWTRQSISALCCWNRCVFSCSCSSFSSTIWLDNEEYSSSIEHPCRHDNSSYSLFSPYKFIKLAVFNLFILSFFPSLFLFYKKYTNLPLPWCKKSSMQFPYAWQLRKSGTYLNSEYSYVYQNIF